MREKDKDFFKLPLTIVASYFIIYLILFNVFSMGIVKFLIFSLVLFLLSIFFYMASNRTKYRSKESYFASISAILLYFSLFFTPSIAGMLSFNIWGWLALMLFPLFLIWQNNEFKKRFFYLALFLLFFTNVVSLLAGSFNLGLIIVIVSAIFCVFLYFYRKKDFEKQLFLKLLFSSSLIIFITHISSFVQM